MIGQTKLIKFFENITFEQLPNPILFLGENGCGKHTLANNIVTKFNLPLIKISKDVTDEDLASYQVSPINTFYYIDLQDFTESAQNKLLKFIEEPSKNIHLILFASSEIGILQTVLNRCVKYKFEQYSIEQLKAVKNIFTSDLVYQICTTPGQLLSLSDTEQCLQDTYDFCKVFVTKINLATYARTISVSTKLNYAENYDKLNIDLFMKLLKLAAYNTYKDTNSEQSLKVYLCTVDYYNRLSLKTLNKETLMINFLTTLWEITR